LETVSGLFIQDPDADFLHIPEGSKIHRIPYIPYPDPQHCDPVPDTACLDAHPYPDFYLMVMRILV
jgi:hypothetical protein